MSLFQWKEELSVGCTEIDSQHKMLFKYADELHTAMLSGKGKDILGNTLADLIAYTRWHFAAEERLMQVHRYPDYPPHKVEHDALTQKVVKLQQDFKSDRVVLSGEIMKFLSDWLNHHIGQIDRKVGTYLQQQAH